MVAISEPAYHHHDIPINNNNPIQFCVDVILKEARHEDRLVKQLCYTMLSAYTNNPINLAINSPSGEGKSWDIHKVGDNFPKQDVMFLAGMSDKALFHRTGILVVKNQESGEYEPIDDQIAEIDSEIEDKECEIESSKDRNFKQARQNQIKDLIKQKKELLKDAKKLIDLSHKILVFLDTPRPELFNAMMPLLSHDKYEVEYEFVDTSQHSGIKTKTNVLRGWPAVIFAQAIDYSHYQRYPEIQRRFIITNPKMTTEKYAGAIDLIGDKFGLPDFAYQETIVSDSEKEKVREIIQDIKKRMLYVCDRIQPGKNSVFVPFSEVVKTLLPKEKAFDMTTANRFFSFLTLLPLVNIDRRPMIVIRKEGNPIPQTIPFALFEDLQECVFLMEYANNGIRPYILEWYYDVFLETYNEKKEAADSAASREQIALTTQDLVDKTLEIYGKICTKKQILQNYVYHLINQGCIDSIQSELDHREKIFYPMIILEKSSKNSNLFLLDERNNFSQQSKIYIENPMLYPNKEYVTSKIQALLGYSSRQALFSKILDHEENEITIDELVDKYYNNCEDYFQFDSSKEGVATLVLQPPTAAVTNNILYQQQIILQNHLKNNFLEKREATEDYLQNGEITSELQGKSMYSVENTTKNLKDEINYSSSPKGIISYFSCYHCDYFHTNSEADYQRHVMSNHQKTPSDVNHPCYPTKADIERLGLKAQGKDWEI
jgi:hypothetical protein